MASEITLLGGVTNSNMPYPRPNPVKGSSNPGNVSNPSTFAELTALTGSEQDTVNVHPVAKSESTLVQAD